MSAGKRRQRIERRRVRTAIVESKLGAEYLFGIGEERATASTVGQSVQTRTVDCRSVGADGKLGVDPQSFRRTTEAMPGTELDRATTQIPPHSQTGIRRGRELQDSRVRGPACRRRQSEVNRVT
jgi:hypothetical protein